MARNGFSFLACPDGQLIRARIAEQLLAHPQEHGPWDRHVYWGDEGLPAQFWEHLTLQGLFALPKALIIRNAHNLPADEWKKLSATLCRAVPASWTFLCLEVAFERRKAKVPAIIQKTACWKFALKQGWIWESPGLDKKSLYTFAEQWARKRGLDFAPGALRSLCDALPADAATACTELEKLALLADPQGIIPADTAILPQHSDELDIFAFIRAVQSGTQQHMVWHKVLSAHSVGDSMVFQFLGLLQREARILWQLLAGEPVRLPPAVLQAKTQLAQQISLRGIMRIWDLAMEAEKGIKSGERSPEQAMEALISGLLVLFTPHVSSM